MDNEYAEYRCSACKKAIKSQVYQCKSCVKCFFHPGCVSKHKAYDKNMEYVPCPGPFKKFMIETGKETTGNTGSTCGSAGRSTTGSGPTGMEVKIDWIVRNVKEMKDEMVCRKEIKMLIKEAVQEEVNSMKQELEELRNLIRKGIHESAEGVRGSYSEVVKRKKENIIIVKPKIQQESEKTKQVIKENVNIKNMPMGVSKLRKGREGTVILGCETREEMMKLKDTVQTKLGKNYSVTESLLRKPKIKIVNVGEDEMKMEEEELIHIIQKQNNMEGSCINIAKKIWKRKSNENRQQKNTGNEGGSIIIEADEESHGAMMKKEKLNIGWRKCLIYNHVNVKRCFKCWGYYHIAKNCKRDETCHKCAGKHKASECTGTRNKCINCMFKIKTYNLKINDEHDALSTECPTYKRAIEEEKRRVGWEREQERREEEDPSPLHQEEEDVEEDDAEEEDAEEEKKEDLNDMPWFHGMISGETAELKLWMKEDGTFLVRESNNVVGDYALCVSYQGSVKQYKVQYENKMVTINGVKKFATMKKMLNYYQQEQGGLCTKLEDFIHSGSMSAKWLNKQAQELRIAKNRLETLQTKYK